MKSKFLHVTTVLQICSLKQLISFAAQNWKSFVPLRKKKKNALLLNITIDAYAS
jgi:hypothetical protein